MRIRIGRLSVVPWLTLVLAACGPAHQVPESESVLTISYGFGELVAGPDVYMPSRFLAFEPLVAYDDSSGQTEGRLARSWEHSPDYRRWTVRLRSDVRWHDGQPFTAHDVKFTLDLLARPEVGDTPAGTDVRVLDDSTFSVAFPRPTNALSDWTVYYPRHLLKDLDPARFRNWEFWSQPVGNGPFRYVRHVPGVLVELEANADYYRGRPRLDRLRLRLGENSVAQFLSGEVDVLPYRHQVSAAPFADDPRFRVYRAVSASRTRVLLWNHRHPALADASVRQALTLALDRRALYRLLQITDDVPVIDAVFTYGQFRRRELPEAFPYDPARAASLLDRAGWRDSDGDGVRDRNGQPLRFALLAPPAGADRPAPPEHTAAVFVQDQLRRIGVAAEIRSLDFGAAVRERVLARRFDAAISIAQLQKVRGARGLSGLFGANSPTAYDNPRLTALLAAAADAVDPDSLDALYRQVTEIFRADLPLTVLFPDVRSTVAHRRVRGLVSPHRVDPFWHAFDLLVEENR